MTMPLLAGIQVPAPPPFPGMPGLPDSVVVVSLAFFIMIVTDGERPRAAAPGPLVPYAVREPDDAWWAGPFGAGVCDAAPDHVTR